MWCVIVSTYCWEQVNSAIPPQLTGLQKTLPQQSSVAAIQSAVQTLLFAVIQNTILFCSGSLDRPMLTQFNRIVSTLQMFLNHDPINVNCVSFVALHRNRRTVWAFWDQNLRAVHPLPFFATPDSHHHVCLAISTIVARRQNLIAIEVNLPQLYLDSKLSTIEPQSCGLQKKRSSIATGF